MVPNFFTVEISYKTLLSYYPARGKTDKFLSLIKGR